MEEFKDSVSLIDVSLVVMLNWDSVAYEPEELSNDELWSSSYTKISTCMDGRSRGPSYSFDIAICRQRVIGNGVAECGSILLVRCWSGVGSGRSHLDA